LKPYYQDAHRTLYNHDCRSMFELPDESVQCVVTSPPYWGLRKYAGQQDLIWGGNPGCEHKWNPTPPRRNRKTTDAGNNPKQGQDAAAFDAQYSNTFALCGAWYGGFGLEPNPDLYVRHTIEILREIRRVLRKDGVVFWNIGDSYATHASGGKGYAHNFRPLDVAVREGIDQPKPTAKSIGLKEKDLCLIPFRVAIAAQEDGWWVRSDIIWSKNNPMPESVTDRPTNSHEYILMLTKSARYYWDAEAVKEACLPVSIERAEYAWHQKKTDDMVAINHVQTERMGERFVPLSGRNLRSVWTFPTQPYKGAHFATFPEALPERCIKAATPEAGCCPQCCAPWVRVLEKKKGKRHESESQTIDSGRGEQADRGKHASPTETSTLGWKPSCQCQTDKPPVPSLVLDPFAGSGTTLFVAARLGRRAVGYEISEEYCRLIINRNKQHVLV